MRIHLENASVERTSAKRATKAVAITRLGGDIAECIEPAGLFRLAFIALFVGNFPRRSGINFRVIPIRQYVSVNVNRSIHVGKEREYAIRKSYRRRRYTVISREIEYDLKHSVKIKCGNSVFDLSSVSFEFGNYLVGQFVYVDAFSDDSFG